MFSAKLLVPATWILSVAAAQSASVCSQATATINSQADAAQFTSCSSISGTVMVSSTASGAITLDGPSTIGDLVVNNATGLTSLASSTIAQIEGTFSLTDLTLLSNLQFGDLTAVKTIDFSGLPTLSQLQFSSTVSEAESVTISNTFLGSLDGIDLATVATLNINNNLHLTSFTTSIANITQSAVFNANGQGLVVQFPNLIWAANLTFRDITNLTISSLEAVNGSLGFYETSLASISAPNLTSVGSSLAFVDNTALTNISMDRLSSVGGADQIANNTLLGAISFPSLADVGGAIDFTGNFTIPSLPKLANVKGGFNIQSEQDITAGCTAFKAESGSGKAIQGTFTCKETSNVQSLTTGTSSSSSSSASSTSSKGAAVSYGVSEAAAGLSVIGGLLQMLL